jgi:DNA-binding XRE family transcriptional regulator
LVLGLARCFGLPCFILCFLRTAVVPIELIAQLRMLVSYGYGINTCSTTNSSSLPLLILMSRKSFRPDLSAIGRRIREIRGFDLNQADFGKLLGVGQRQLSKYEQGQSAPTLEVLIRLKTHSGRTIDWIVLGE